MDWIKYKESAGEYLKKFKYLILVLVCGIVLMVLPEKEQISSPAPAVEASESENLQAQLQHTVSLIHGVGKASVLLTQKKGEETIYQTDEDLISQEGSVDRRRNTVMHTDSDRQQTGLIRQINPPVLQGAVVVCQGAEDPKVKLAVVEAVMRATGLPSNSICVLKMK